MWDRLNGTGNLPEAACETLSRLEEGRGQARNGFDLLTAECHQLAYLISHEFDRRAQPFQVRRDSSQGLLDLR
jgi:hypothetical protein